VRARGCPVVGVRRSTLCGGRSLGVVASVEQENIQGLSRAPTDLEGCVPS
jgi:hypothetical protein